MTPYQRRMAERKLALAKLAYDKACKGMLKIGPLYHAAEGRLDRAWMRVLQAEKMLAKPETGEL